MVEATGVKGVMVVMAPCYAHCHPCSKARSAAKKHEEHGHKMKPLPHLYEVSLSGGPTGHATLLAAGVPPLRSAPPKEFDGPGDAWSPEQFLLAAVGTCFMFTFRAVARGSKFDYSSLDLSGSGTVDREKGTTRFTEIVLRPRLTLPNGADPERAKTNA